MSCIHIVDILERASCLHWEDCKALLRATDNPAITATSLKQAKSGVFAPHQPLPKLATALALHKRKLGRRASDRHGDVPSVLRSGSSSPLAEHLPLRRYLAIGGAR
ncbi:hypothetical protein C6P46_006469 [Rhodotorula mucilaginosa]|uniref:Uncharacterized protein n=1 Tax=Rhodotorula mucilaginosa TaxID=5537 RepID=A0A9P6VYK8_RHOMI|nr:hypothetical protein C6P46_006469 [Rhodotorula mucilaginosa]